MFKYTWEDLGSMIHTALRKACDSDATSVAYNAIQVIEDRGWSNLLKRLLKNVDETDIINSIRSEWLKDPWDAWYNDGNYQDGVKGPRPLNSEMLLYCIGRMFDDQDWQGICCYLVD